MNFYKGIIIYPGRDFTSWYAEQIVTWAKEGAEGRVLIVEKRTDDMRRYSGHISDRANQEGLPNTACSFEDYWGIGKPILSEPREDWGTVAGIRYDAQRPPFYNYLEHEYQAILVDQDAKDEMMGRDILRLCQSLNPEPKETTK